MSLSALAIALAADGPRREVPGVRDDFEGWFDDVDRMTDVAIRKASPEEPRWSGHAKGQQVTRVAVTVDLQWRWFHNDGSLEEGPTIWGYSLVRASGDDPWRIFGQGAG